MPSQLRLVFMADCQLGCYATFSGLGADGVARYAGLGMKVGMVEETSGCDWDAARYRAAVAEVNALRPDLVVMGGDMVDDCRDRNQLTEFLAVTAGLDRIPMHWLPGNHDIAFDAVVPTAESIALYHQNFGPDRYIVRHNDVTLIMVNTTIWQHPEEVPDQYPDHIDFLAESLREAADSRHILVFGHHPLFMDDAEEADLYWNIPALRRKVILDLMVAHGVKAFFCGHLHRNGGGRYLGMEVVASGPVGYPLGEDPSGYRLIEIESDRIRHTYLPLKVGE